ncbi:GTPase-activating protein GYP5 [Smittium mucronatum]|uniref:GTPase-activating protein GYP5 n=1 Tax=Smittium mucronatum TaxID=133383 RepID=A0A1R0H0J5_9FUNG|nr:GTPase-activating protein GYP5 [Smittium mucronatum]
MVDVQPNSSIPNTSIEIMSNQKDLEVSSENIGSVENLKKMFSQPQADDPSQISTSQPLPDSNGTPEKIPGYNASKKPVLQKLDGTLHIAPRPDVDLKTKIQKVNKVNKSPVETAFNSDNEFHSSQEDGDDDHLFKNKDASQLDFDPTIDTKLTLVKSTPNSQNSSETLQANEDLNDSFSNDVIPNESKLASKFLEKINSNKRISLKSDQTQHNWRNSKIQPSNINLKGSDSFQTPNEENSLRINDGFLMSSEEISSSNSSLDVHKLPPGIPPKTKQNALNDSLENLPLRLNSLDLSRSNRISIRKINSVDPSIHFSKASKHHSVNLGAITGKLGHTKNSSKLSPTESQSPHIKLQSPSDSTQENYRNSIAEFYSSNTLPKSFGSSRYSQPSLSSQIDLSNPSSLNQPIAKSVNKKTKPESFNIVANTSSLIVEPIDHNVSNNTTFFNSVSSLFSRKSGQTPIPPQNTISTDAAQTNNPSFLAQGMFSSIGDWIGKSSNNRVSNSSSSLPPSSSEIDNSDPSVAFILSQIKEKNQDLINDPKATLFEREELHRQLQQSRDNMKKEGRSSEINWEFWGELISNFEQVVKKNPIQLSKQIHLGIPQEIRGTVWQLFSGSTRDPSLLSGYRDLLSLPSPHDKQITRDLDRTFPENSFFQKSEGNGQSSLFNVLHAYSLYDTEMGYCQGLAFVAGPLLLNMPEEEAFCVFERLMNFYKLRGIYIPSMILLQLRLYQLDRLIEEHLPTLSKHFVKEGVRSSMYASQWFMTLFAYCLPMNLVFLVFDIIFAEGVDCLLQISLAVLKRSQAVLLTLPFEKLIKYLTGGNLFEYYTDRPNEAFMHDIESVTVVTLKRLARLTRDHEILIQKSLNEENSKEILKNDNKRLESENKHLLDKLQSLSFEHSDLMSQFVSTRLELSHSQEIISQLSSKIQELEFRVESERKLAEESLKEDMEQLANKNLELALKHQILEDKTDELENALVRVNTLYADSENDRLALLNKWNELRKAMN